MPEPIDRERFEELLRGYALPATSRELDRRVLEHGIAIVTEAHGSLWEEIAHAALHHLGFGHLAWLLDLVTATDAEYDVECA